MQINIKVMQVSYCLILFLVMMTTLSLAATKEISYVGEPIYDYQQPLPIGTVTNNGQNINVNKATPDWAQCRSQGTFPFFNKCQNCQQINNEIINKQNELQNRYSTGCRVDSDCIRVPLKYPFCYFAALGANWGPVQQAAAGWEFEKQFPPGSTRLKEVDGYCTGRICKREGPAFCRNKVCYSD